MAIDDVRPLTFDMFFCDGSASNKFRSGRVATASRTLTFALNTRQLDRRHFSSQARQRPSIDMYDSENNATLDAIVEIRKPAAEDGDD